MPRTTDRLSDARIKRLTTPGRYPDGNGLHLQVTVGRDGEIRRSWFVRFYLLDGRQRDMGLGPYPVVMLHTARGLALAARREAKANRDPLATRQAVKTAAKAPAKRVWTFRQCSEAYIEANSARWRSAKHAAQWTTTLTTYAYPTIGDLPVSAITKRDVLGVLQPIWLSKTETASRVRQRIENVFDWAIENEHRTGDNPARANLFKHSLPSRAALKKTKPVRHHPALPYADMSAFWRDLADRDGAGADALRFTILTAARTNETIGATWAEFDLDNALWTVPAVRMKAARDHRVPLSAPVLALLRAIRAKAVSGDPGATAGPCGADPVFVAPDGGSLSNMTMLALLERMGRTDITVHGFRSTFRDWVAEQTNFARELAEVALAHAVGDDTEAAYQRGDLLDKRKQLMAAWARYVDATAKKVGDVVQFSRKRL